MFYIIHATDNFNSLCGANLSLNSSIQSVQINFNVPKSIAATVPDDCICTITLLGDDESLYLFSAITELEGFNRSIWENKLKIIYEDNHKIIKLIMKEPMECYFTATPVKR